MISPARRDSLRTGLLWSLPLAYLATFYFFPLASILAVSFGRLQANGIPPLLQSLVSPSILHILGFTFYQAALSTILTLALGLPGAYLSRATNSGVNRYSRL